MAKKVISQFPLESNDLAKYRYVEDKVVIVMFHPSEINATARTAPKLPSHLRLYHFGSATLDGVSHGYHADKNEFRFAATDTGGLTNVSVPMNQGGIPHLLGVADPTTCSHASVYRTWLKHSGKNSFSTCPSPNSGGGSSPLLKGVMLGFVKNPDAID